MIILNKKEPLKNNIMQIDKFEMERMQCTYEHVVDYNLSESGVLPLKMSDLVDDRTEKLILDL